MPEAVINFQVKSKNTRKQIQRIINLTGRHLSRLERGVEVNLVSAFAIKKLNKKFRRINRPTDVLSFALSEASWSVPSEPLGVIYLAPEYIKKQSKLWQVNYGEEFIRCLVHGLLHISGFDHLKPTEAKKMFALQEKIVHEVKSL